MDPQAVFKLTDQGVPLQDATCHTALNSYTGGIYKLRYGPVVARRLATISKIFRQEWGEKPEGRLTVVLCGRHGTWDLEQALQYYEDNGIDYHDVIDGLGDFGYFYGAPDKRGWGGYGPTQFKEMMDEHLDFSYERKSLRENVAFARKLGLPLYGYEGGQHIFTAPTFNRELRDGGPEVWTRFLQPLLKPGEKVTSLWGMLNRIQSSPQMGEMYRRLLDMWFGEGADMLMHYTFAGSSWGLLPNLRSPGCVKWDAVMAHLLPAGDATLDGKVDAEDLKIVQEHLGREGTWRWEQGDFNADNKVDAKDLRMLRKNLQPADDTEKK